MRALSDARHEVDEAPNGNVAIEKLHEGQYDVVLSDLKMGGSDGLDVLRTTKTLHPTTAVILMTAFGSVHTAVEAMKSGAFDYVQKPFEIEEMEVKIEKALEVRRMRHELDYLRHTQNDIYDFDRIVGASTALQRVLGVVRKVAKSNTTVLVRGETGTGKELIAGAIHHNSLRAARNFVKNLPKGLQVGLLAFDSSARVIVSPTSERDGVITGINNLQVGGATATASAITAALESIKALPKAANGKQASAALVLMSDGTPTIGENGSDPEAAVQNATAAAKAAGVPIDTIAFGTANGTLQQNGETVPVPADPAAMAEIAKGSGGKSFTAKNVDQLNSVYNQIRSACERGVAVLLISSELDELLSVAHRIVVLYRGRIMGQCRAHPAERGRIGAMMAGHEA